jgi:hypothetical protein
MGTFELQIILCHGKTDIFLNATRNLMKHCIFVAPPLAWEESLETIQPETWLKMGFWGDGWIERQKMLVSCQSRELPLQALKKQTAKEV